MTTTKGYRIYWLEKKSITVERNIIFNQGDTNASKIAIIHGEMQSEGEKAKIIQAPQNNVKDQPETETQKSGDQVEPEKVAESHQTLKSTNSITFPSSPEPEIEPEPEPQDADPPPTQNYGRGQRARPQKGHYKAMNKGLIAAIAPSVDNISDDEEFEEIVEHHDDL